MAHSPIGLVSALHEGGLIELCGELCHLKQQAKSMSKIVKTTELANRIAVFQETAIHRVLK